jgi:sec-independent protein translocase protein TatA
MFNFLRNIGPTELIIIGVIILVFFGARKIADFGKNAGEATKEVKKIKDELTGKNDKVSSDKSDQEKVE